MRSLLAFLATCMLFTGCITPRADRASKHASSSEDEALVIRNNAASLLYALLNEEKHASKLLIIKRDRKELSKVMKNISGTAGRGVKKLEELAKTDPSLDLKTTSLPAGEQAARELQSAAITKQLLQSKGQTFEFRLLMAQAQALGYATALARVAATNEADPSRRQEFEHLAVELGVRHREVIRMIQE